MSLFEYAQEVVSKKLERKKPMLSVSMGSMPMPDKMQTYMNRPVLPNTPAGKMDGSPFMEAAEKRGIPTTNKNMNMMVDLVNRGVPLQEAANLTEQKLMPMAQGGGLSSVQNSLNINGQPHRLAYINPNEENLLKSLGGSGRKIDGIPAYDDSVDGGSDQGGPGPGDPGDPGSMGVGGYSEAQSVATTQGLSDAMANNPDTFGADPMGVVGNVASFVGDPTQSASMGLGTNQNLQGPIDAPPPDIGFFGRVAQGLLGFTNKGYSVNPDMTYSQNIGIGVPGTASAVAAALGFDPSIATFTGPTTSPGGNQGDNDDDDGTDAGGDDIIIREKIAAVKQIPVEEVTVEEVQRAKRLTAAQRVTGTRLEDILDDIYGSGKGAGLLGIPTNNTGTA